VKLKYYGNLQFNMVLTTLSLCLRFAVVQLHIQNFEIHLHNSVGPRSTDLEPITLRSNYSRT